MKIILLGDLHIGARNASMVLCDYQIKFFKSVLFPYMKRHKINTIFQTGDVFDTRKFTNHLILDIWQREVFDYMHENNISFHCLVGNHDSLYKNTLEVNSPSQHLSWYDNLYIYSHPSEVDFDGMKILALPWICDGNMSASLDLISNSDAKVVIGHLELAKFELFRGQLCDNGMDHTLFKKYDHVFSGHFHHKSDYDNILYLGCPYEFTWVDYNDPKGFHVFDTATMSNKFVKNPDRLFHKIEYDDRDKDENYWKSFDVEKYIDRYVSLVVINKTNSYQFDRLVSALDSIGCADFKIAESIVDNSVEFEEEELTDVNSIQLVEKYIDTYDFDGDKKKLKTLMQTLYVESLQTLE